MIITCPKCDARLIFPDEKIGPGNIQLKCSMCSAPFEFRISSEKGSSDKEPPANSVMDQKSEASYEEQKSASPKGSPPVDAAYVERLKRRYSYKTAEKEKLEEKRFIEYLPDVFTFPLKGGGLTMVVVGSVFFTVVLFFSSYSFILGAIGNVFVWGYLSSFMMKIVSHTAYGEIDVPDWPDFTDWWDDIISPMFRMFAVVLVSYLPLIIYLIPAALQHNISMPVMILLLILGTLYQPMAIISMSMFNTARALTPTIVLPAISTALSDYVIAWGVMLLLLGAKGGFTYFVKIPVLGAFLDSFVMLYLLIVEMRILGLIYYANKEKLGWF